MVKGFIERIKKAFWNAEDIPALEKRIASLESKLNKYQHDYAELSNAFYSEIAIDMTISIKVLADAIEKAKGQFAIRATEPEYCPHRNKFITLLGPNSRNKIQEATYFIYSYTQQFKGPAHGLEKYEGPRYG